MCPHNLIALSVVTAPLPSPYEQQALEDIRRWKNPPKHWLSDPLAQASQAWHDLTDRIRDVPGVAWVMDNVVTGLLQLTNEITQDSVWTEAIHREYAAVGHAVAGPEDIRRLDLAQIDGRIRGLATKYQTLAAVEGAATGFAGLPGLVPDLVALVALNLRAAGEYAAYCGFNIGLPDERLYALTVLDFVARPGSKAKEMTLKPALTTASRVARQQVVKAVEDTVTMRAIQNLVRSLGLHLTQAKLAQLAPVAGAAVGSTYNAWYTGRVCEAAFHLYRERFIETKYAPVHDQTDEGSC